MQSELPITSNDVRKATKPGMKDCDGDVAVICFSASPSAACACFRLNERLDKRQSTHDPPPCIFFRPVTVNSDPAPIGEGHITEEGVFYEQL